MKKVLLLWVWGCLACGMQAQAISNGSFENGNLEGWTTSGGTFTPTDAYDSAGQVDGRWCLRVGSNGAAELRSAAGRVQSSTKLVSFTAKTLGESNAELLLTVEGTDFNGVRYVIRPHWCTYYLPFQNDADVTLTFRFSSSAEYLIDNICLDDQNSTVIDVESTYLWNSRFGEDWGWVDGDNDISLDLPNGFRMWFFNDSFYDTHNDKTNVFGGGRFLRNAMLVQHPFNYLFSKYTGTAESTTRYFECVDPSPEAGVDNLYWLGDAVFTDEEKIKVVLVEVLAQPGGTVASGRTYVATFDYPFDFQNVPYPTIERRIDAADGYETVVYDEDYAYLYRGISQGWSQSTHVARCAKNDLTGQAGTWEFYTGSGWSPNAALSQKVCDYDPSGVVKLHPGNYALVYMPILSREVRVSFAPTPVGPWTASQLVYTRPDDEKYWSYMPNIHQKLDNGKYSISYSVNCWEEWGPAFNDKFFYRQRYIQVDLLGLSPYTRTDVAATCYRDGFFMGPGYGLPAGTYDSSQLRQWGIYADWISSLDLTPGYRAVLYKGDHCTGESMTMESGSWDLGDFNDAVKSMRIEEKQPEGVEGHPAGTSSLRLYPNPADKDLWVESASEQEVLLSDMSGRVLGKYLLSPGRNRMEIRHLSPGQYLVRGQFETLRFTKK